MDPDDRPFKSEAYYKGWEILLAVSYDLSAGDTKIRVRVRAGDDKPIDVSPEPVARQVSSEARALAIAHAQSFIDALEVHGGDSLRINFPARAQYRHPMGVYFPVMVNEEECRALVTRECLGDHFGDPADGNWKRLFELHRVQVQRIAESLIRAGARSNILINRSVWPS